MLIDVQILNQNVGILKMQRPEKRNALNIVMLKEFILKFEQLELNEQIRVILLEGEGVCFCSGLDLCEANDRTQIEESAELIKTLLLKIYTSTKITIASVHGAAMAGGAGLMGICDIIVATSDCKISLPELKRGLVPAFIITFLRRKLAEGVLRELVVTGRVLTGIQAKEIGLVHYIVSENERAVFIERLTQDALQSAPGAVIHTKQLLDVLYGRKIEEELKIAEKAHRLSRDSTEAAIGIQAFFEKREPDWSR